MKQYLFDSPVVEREFQQVIKEIKHYKNGVTSDAILARGSAYSTVYGVSIPDLRTIASKHKKNHLLAMKLWNKGWRETLILATMLEDASEASSQQLDYWIKSITTIEMAEQLALNLLPYHKDAVDKAREWSIGKKRLVKITGLLTFGNLSRVLPIEEREELEVIFEILPPLIKDRELTTVIIRVVDRVAKIGENIREITKQHANQWLTFNEESAKFVANEVLENLKHC